MSLGSEIGEEQTARVFLTIIDDMTEAGMPPGAIVHELRVKAQGMIPVEHHVGADNFCTGCGTLWPCPRATWEERQR